MVDYNNIPKCKKVNKFLQNISTVVEWNSSVAENMFQTRLFNMKKLLQTLLIISSWRSFHHGLWIRSEFYRFKIILIYLLTPQKK